MSRVVRISFEQIYSSLQGPGTLAGGKGTKDRGTKQPFLSYLLSAKQPSANYYLVPTAALTPTGLPGGRGQWESGSMEVDLKNGTSVPQGRPITSTTVERHGEFQSLVAWSGSPFL